MATAYLREFDAGADRTTTNYDEIGRRLRLDEEPPAGLLLHSAGFTEAGKFRIFEIWETQDLEERFVRDRMMPTVREVVGEGGTAPRTESYELHRMVVNR